MESSRTLSFIEIPGIPEIKPGDDLAITIINNAYRHNINFLNNDILIITQKIISKAEDRFRNLGLVIPSTQAKEIALRANKDPRLVQLILEESSVILRVREGLIISRHKNGYVCANAGIDHSNTTAGDIEGKIVLLLPKNPDRSARRIKNDIYKLTKKHVGVIIIDSHGRAWRNGTIGTAIGLAGVPGIVDLRGKEDLYGYKLRATLIAVADELAAGASLVMGQADESIPCVIARGFPYGLRESSIKELIRNKKNDLFP